MRENRSPARLTEFGFEYGPAEVTRLCTDGDGGVWIEIATARRRMRIRVTPTGLIRVTEVVAAEADVAAS